MNMPGFLNNMAATGVTLGRGVASTPAPVKPVRTLELYDMEGCPFCRVVREALTELDLDAMIFPCPRGGERFRSLVRARGGKEQFPFLVDPNTGVELFESADIVDYLYATYGGRQAPSPLRLKAINTTTSFLASMLRAGKGIKKRDATIPDQPLALWSFEASPFARPVREVLCEMEIPYLLHNVGRTVWQDWLLPVMREHLVPDYTPGTPNRIALLARAGKVQVPYLFDPNTGEELFESEDIIDYLQRHYAGEVSE